MSERLQRASEEVREILAGEIQKLKDPRLGFVTVTGVKVTPDLRKARVFYTVLGDERERRGTAAALRSARSHLRVALGHQLRMKFTPELVFEEDPGPTSDERIEELLRLIHEREAGNATGTSESESESETANADADRRTEEAS
jgi:ribosome-binding factor A